jgi:hypothetical protein
MKHPAILKLMALIQQTLLCHTQIKGVQSICITLQQVEQVFARFQALAVVQLKSSLL